MVHFLFAPACTDILWRYIVTCVQVKHAGVAGRVQLMKEADSEVREAVS